MWWLALEAVGAAALLIGIVWWTMFSGRKRGEREVDRQTDTQRDVAASTDASEPNDRQESPPKQQ